MTSFLKERWNAEGGLGEVLVLAFPLILSTGSWSIQHFVDRMFLSWYSPEAIAAAMPSGILNFAVMSLFIGTASYVSTFVAQYNGAGMNHRVGPAMWQGIYFSIIGGIFMLCLMPLSGPIFDYVGHEQAIRVNEIVFFKYICLGGFPVIASSVLSGFYTGLGRPWPVMWVNVFATVVTLVLDYVLIFGNWGFPEMGMKGAAIAMVISAYFSFFTYIGLLAKSSHKKAFGIFSGWRPDRDLFGRLIRFGLPSGIQFALDMAGFSAFVLILGRLGEVNLAATNIAFNINTLAFMPMVGIGIAVSVLVGRYLGSGRPEIASRSTYSGFIMTFVYMSSIAVLYAAVPEIFTAPFAANSDSASFLEIKRLAEILLRFVALYSIFDTMNVIFASALKGAGDTRFVMYMIVLVSLFVLVLPTYIMIMVLGYGIMAAWTIATVYVILLGFMFLFRFRQGSWKKMRVIEGYPITHLIPPAVPECPDAKFEP